MPRIPLEKLVDRAAFCDPASGRVAVKKTRARSAIVVVTQDWLSRIFVLYAWADRTTTDRLYEKIFWVQQNWTPRLFGVESNAMQTLFADGLRREARHRNIRLPLIDVYQPTTIQKPFRNRAALQESIASSRYLMVDDQVELYHELATHPMNPLCDLVDALASAVALLPRRPLVTSDNREEVAYATYLRRSRLTDLQIARRLAEWRKRKPTVHVGLQRGGWNASQGPDQRG